MSNLSTHGASQSCPTFICHARWILNGSFIAGCLSSADLFIWPTPYEPTDGISAIKKINYNGFYLFSDWGRKIAPNIPLKVSGLTEAVSKLSLPLEELQQLLTYIKHGDNWFSLSPESQDFIKKFSLLKSFEKERDDHLL